MLNPVARGRLDRPTSTTLQALSYEMKELIFSFCATSDLLNTSLTCRLLREACLPTLLRTVTLVRNEKLRISVGAPFRPLSLMNMLLDKPELASYILRIEMVPTSRTRLDDYNASQPSADSMLRFSNAVDRFPALDIKRWKEHIAVRSDAAILTLLIALCPNIRSLDIPAYYMSFEELSFQILSGVCRERLFEVQLTYWKASWDRLQGTSDDTFLRLVGIPNIRSLSFSELSSFPFRDLSQDVISDIGKLRRLSLHRTSIRLDDLCHLLQQLPRLSKLEIEFAVFMYETSFIFGSLKRGLMYLKDTLQCLKIGCHREYVRKGESLPEIGDDDSLRQFLPLKDFRQLTTLHISPSFLYGAMQPEDAPPMVHMLPQGLQTLTLTNAIWFANCPWSNGFSENLEIVREFMTGKRYISDDGDRSLTWKAGTPCLQNFYFERVHGGWDEPDFDAEFERFCEAQGLNFEKALI